MRSEFQNYALKQHGISSLKMDRYISRTNDYITPYIIEERPMNITQLDVFSRLMKDRIIFMGVPIDDDVANIIQAQLLFLESQDSERDIQIYVNSPGGMVYAGLGIYDTMQYLKPDVSTICTGMAASMAAVLMCAGAKGKRFALPHSRVMIHDPLSYNIGGSALSVKARADDLMRIRDITAEVIVRHTGKSMEEVLEVTSKDTYFEAQEAIAFGLADRIVEKI